MDQDFYSLKAKTSSGSEVVMSHYQGKVVLVVNTASKCGFTPQYAGLEALHKRYHEKGLVVLGFPCDQFAHQEPGNAAEIQAFCQKNYGVTFQLMEKTNVNGSKAHPVFAFLRHKAPGLIGNSVKWNFTKFLVSKDGKRVKRFSPSVSPENLEADILRELEA